MVARYNKRAQDLGLAPGTMSAMTGDIMGNEKSEPAEVFGPRMFDFDFVGMANALHHMPDPQSALERMTQRLKPGGVLFITDWVVGAEAPDSDKYSHMYGENPEELTAVVLEDHNHGPGHDHGHHGHTRSDSPHSSNGPTWKSHGQFGVTYQGFTKEHMQKFLTTAGCTEVESEVLEKPFSFPPAFGGMEKRAIFAKGRRST